MIRQHCILCSLLLFDVSDLGPGAADLGFHYNQPLQPLQPTMTYSPIIPAYDTTALYLSILY